MLAESLETQIVIGKRPETAKLEQLEGRISALLEQFDLLLQDSDVSRPLSSAPQMDPALFNSLVKALRQRDLRAIDYFEAIQASLVESIGQELTAEVGSCIDGLDFNAALANLNQFVTVQSNRKH